jgi:hypothetical protein
MRVAISERVSEHPNGPAADHMRQFDLLRGVIATFVLAVRRVCCTTPRTFATCFNRLVRHTNILVRALAF